MALKTWTDEQLAILDNEYPTANLKELAGRCGKTPGAIKSKALIRKLKRSPEAGFWNKERTEELKVLYADHTNEEIAKAIGSTPSAVSGRAFKLRLKKSREFILLCSAKSSFPKGHQPMNKGRKQTEYMSAEQIEKTRKTQFKKGHLPKNHKPIGYHRITRDGYIEVKAAEPNVFELKHRLVWIEHNGKIPPGYNIQFRDGNRQNICIENLYMISRSEQLRAENSLHARYPEEIRHLIQLKGALNRQINKAAKKITENGCNTETQRDGE